LLESIQEDNDTFWKYHPLWHLLQTQNGLSETRTFSKGLFDWILFAESNVKAELELASQLADFLIIRMKEDTVLLQDVFAAGQCLLALITTSKACRLALLKGYYESESLEKTPISKDLPFTMISCIRRWIDMSKEWDEAMQHVVSILYRLLIEWTFEEKMYWTLNYMPLLQEDLIYRTIDRLHYRPPIIDATILLCRLSRGK
jgi:hypothetical protein